MLKKLAAPLGMLALLGAGTVTSTGCEIITPVDRSKIGEGGAGGSGGGTSTSTGTTGCTAATECPGTDTDCQTRTCTAGVCGFENAAAGTATKAQTPGDCQASVCDGMGATSTQNDDTDVLDDSNDCTDDVCTAGAPENKPKASGVTCTDGGGKVCDGASKCVECVDAAACASGVCDKNNCIAATCLDLVKNDGETDVDCGGTDCNPCADGKVCALGTDCVNTICTGGLCAAATCTDVAKNGDETDVDCGGLTCTGCGPDLGCKLDADCVGGSCSGTTCLPTCTDKVKNSNETDVDCGGPACTKCDDGKTCAVAGDCSSSVCTGGTCQVPSCTDGVQNGTESDLDCGGSCNPCGATQMCTKGADCATGVCTGNVCQGAVCNDGVKNGSETDVDCGGICATKCATGQICGAAGDCASSVCTGGLCQAAICGDGVKNGVEDCDDGNPVSNDGCSSACAVEAGYTCVGTVCTTTCGDGIKAGAEQCDDTNTTTGDGCSSACAIELGFTCSGAPSVCATTCGDGVQAGTEVCDDGNGIPADGCTACAKDVGFTCTGTAPTVCTATCGDGIKVSNEGCDDGNTTAGDGCSATCTVQSGFSCTGTTPSVCATICGDGIKAGAEQCDDNNLANGDCCSSTCTIEAGCEIEPNGTIATANNFATLSVGNKINGFIKPAADKDYFAFTVPAGAVGTLTATGIDNFLGVTCASANIDTFMTLFDSAAVSLATNDDINGAANRCSTITQGGLAAGTYYIELKAFSSSAQFAYTMQASLGLAICGNGITEGAEECDGGPLCAADCTLIPVCGNGTVSSLEICDDGNTANGDGCNSSCNFEGGTNEVEPNNTFAQADSAPVISGDAQLLASIGQSGDKDIFKVTVATGTAFRFETFETTYDCATLAMKLTLFDSAGAQLKVDASGTVASGIGSCAALVVYLAPGSYYVQVERTTLGTIGKYIFEAKVLTDDGAEVEPNDTDTTANALAGTNMFIAGAYASGDEDWYAVTLPSTMSIRAEIVEGDATTCDSFDVDSQLELYDAAATSLVYNDDDGRGFCSAIDGTGATPRDSAAHDLAAGTYYLQVTGYTDPFNYRLAVTVR